MNQIKFFRTENYLSQYELAEMLGIPRWRVQLLEAGFARPTPEEIFRIESVIGKLGQGERIK